MWQVFVTPTKILHHLKVTNHLIVNIDTYNLWSLTQKSNLEKQPNIFSLINNPMWLGIEKKITQCLSYAL